jgi:DNA-binding response OmpR family regulator
VARKGLGAILREADLISEGQLRDALAAQKTFGERLASVLVRQCTLTEKFAVTYLGRQLGVPGVDLSRQEIDLELLEVVPLDLCERHLVFPIKVQGTRLQIAMADPNDQKLVSEIEFKTGTRLSPMIALDASIKNAIVEARRALKSGQKTIKPNVQKAQTGRMGAASAAAAADGTGTPRAGAPDAGEPAGDIEVEPEIIEVDEPVMDEIQELALIESLGSAPSALSPAAPPHPPAVEETQTILAVDDDESVLKLIEMVLQTRRYRVLTARGGREALAKVRESMPDLVVLDGMLPEVHGFEICRQLKTSERFRHIPVVMVSAVHTGWRFAADVKQTYGADDYLEKPFAAPDLLRRVEALLNRAPATVAPASEAAARQHLKDGVIALKGERLDDAMAAFNRGLAIDQFSDLLHYYLAMTYEKKDMVFHAIDHYEKAIELNPAFYDAITSLANLYQKQEFWRKAVEMWELALSATKDETVRSRIKDHLLSLL